MERDGESSQYNPQPSLRYPHRNSGLFSDHYLEKTLPDQPEWEQTGQEAEPVRAEVAKIFADYTPTDNEAQTERDLIRPVLEALGHETFEVQPALSTPGGVKRPDYVFYRDEGGLTAGKNVTLTEELLEDRAFAVGDAKYFDRPLDIPLKRRGDAFSNQNPSFQISFYMRYSGVKWGILTNGRLWRLYHRDSAHRLDRFYEVDLSEVLDSPAAFMYFYAFFRREAFEEGPLGLESILSGSVDYARGVGDSLKDQVYEALRHLAQGFLDYPSNGLSTEPETLREIYDASLIALYRLLFILYAESRELLPVAANDDYRESYSLYAIKHQAADNLDRGRKLVARRATLWPQLRELFGIIAEGSPPLSVATFNGGLFDPERHPFLERYSVGDLHLQQAIDHLARVDGEFVDYRDLAERHLGTIYEGLLEFHLQATDEQAEGGWSVELLNDKGERHRTGSYYTPDYIVSYIVRQAVGPVLAESVEDKSTAEEKIEAVLATDVLDPAMGSGHFLVEATEYIARFLVELGVSQEADGEMAEGIRSEDELVYWKRRVVQSCVYGVDLNPLAVELAKLSLWLSTVARDKPLSFLDHHLRAGNSLVGASVEDVGPGRAPKKRGKGANEGQIQLSLLPDDTFRQSMSAAVEDMWRIERSLADTLAEVKEQEKAYAELKQTLTDRFAQFLDLSVLSRLEPGRKLEQDTAAWRLLAQYLADGSERLPKQVEEWLKEARIASEDYGFFHWELEFPEVFFDREASSLEKAAGFDAVIGNPPYVQPKYFPTLKPYLKAAYPQTYTGTADLYVYFFELGLGKAKSEGSLGYITSGLFSKLEYGAPLRQLLTSSSALVEIVEFGDEQVFEGALTYPIIVCTRNELPTRDATVGLKNAAHIVEDAPPEKNPVPRADDIWAFTKESLQHVIRGWANSRPLGDHLPGTVHRGVTTGFNDAFLVSSATRDELIRKDPFSRDLLKPVVRGEDLGPWYQEDERRYLIFSRRGTDIDAYPVVKDYLHRFRQRLEPKPTGWSGSSWPGRKAGAYEWHEIQDSVDYFEVFEQPRIHSTKVSLYPTFSFSDEVKYALNTSYVLPVADRKIGNYLLGVLNSRVCEFYCRKVFASKANGYFEIQPGELSKFPIPEASEEEQDIVAGLAETLTAEATKRHQLHRRSRRRILTDLGNSESKLNQKLTEWWELDFTEFRQQIKKAFKQDIPVGERDEWEDWLSSRISKHQRLTNEIVHLEKQLNELVYSLFDLSVEEIRIIEESTRYQYGEV